MTPKLIVISSYPPLGQTHGFGTVGVASYTKNTLTSFPSPLDILVLAEKLPNQPLEYQEKNIHVLRCWQRNSISAFLNIFQKLKKHPRIPVLIEFEMAMFGNPLLNIAFPILLLILKLTQHKTTVVLHQVVLNFNEISGHIGQSQKSPLNTLLNFLSFSFFKLVVALSSKIIVFEQFLKNRLDPNNSKINVIPHGVEIKEISPSLKHSEFIITVFGFLAWYKGSDWIVKIISRYFDHHPNSKLKLVIAGGPNPNHLDKPYYQRYLKEINSYANKHPQKIIITGFVPESQISKYYLQSDIIVLPYRVGMSSSGPLSLAFTYHKPFLLSKKISPILQTSDISQLVNPKDVEFELTTKSLLNRLLALQKNPSKIKSLSKASENISISRSWSNISLQYLKCLEL